MTSRAIYRQFLDFFASKDHKIIPSAPMVAKSDPLSYFSNLVMLVAASSQPLLRDP